MPSAFPPEARVDAVVVGGGPAGLSAALVLARALRSVVVFDGDREGLQARSTWPQVNHNLLGWPDGIEAARLRALGAVQLRAYSTVAVVEDAVREVEALGDGFCATTAEGRRVAGRAILLATGVQDSYPRFPGWETYVGRSLHWCLACDGYEARGRRLVAIGADVTAALDALALRRFSDHVTLLTGTCDGPRVSDEHRARLAAADIAVVTGEVVGAQGSDGHLSALLTGTGERVPCDEAFSLRPSVPRSALARALGAELDAAGFVCVDSEQRTRVPGVVAAGDVTRVHSHQLATALHEGSQAGHAMAWDLLPAQLRA